MARNVGQQLIRGLKSNLPALLLAEIAFTTDTKDVYIGTLSGNMRVTIPIFNASGVQQLNAHIIADKVTIPGTGSITVTFPVSIAFTSATSYVCVASDISAKNRAPKIAQVSGTQIIFTANAGDIVQYYCIGN